MGYCNMRSLFTFFIASVLLQTITFAQKVDTVSVLKDLKGIYSNLEYNTIAFNDLKNKWVVSDPDLVRELFNRFVVNKAIRVNGKNVNMQFILDRTKEIFDGSVIVNLRKRYYDNQIEYFAFVSLNKKDSLYNKPLFDIVDDGFYLRSIIGERLYEKLQKQTYFFSNVTKDEFNSKTGYYFDINLNLLNPEIMFWSTTSNAKNKYLVSVFGQWGSDAIYYPGWTFKQYFGGLQLTYYKELQPYSREYSYKLGLGTGINTSVPYTSSLPKKPFFKSGDNVFIKLSAASFSFVSDKLKNVYFDFEGMYSMNEYQKHDFGINKKTGFYSVRNFVSIKIKAINLFNLADLGMFETYFGFSFNDISKYQINPTQYKIINLEKFTDKFVNFGMGESKTGGLIQHKLQIITGYNPTGAYGYYGLKFSITISGIIGLDVRYYNSFGFDEIKYPWRKDSYLVFSPIIRINY